jgi:uncharacterized protein YecT (DUF1311 family)
MQLDLTRLSTRELRGLLDSARDRGQAAQSYQILEEMARRRGGDGDGENRPRGRRGPRRRPEEPRIITLDLGDPLEPGPEPWAEDPALPLPPSAQAAPDEIMPQDHDDDPLAGLTLAREPRSQPRPRSPRRTLPGLVIFAAGASMGVASGVALAQWVGAPDLTPPSFAQAQPVQNASFQTLAPAVNSPPAPLAAELAPPPPPPPPPPPFEADEPAAPGQLEIALASPDAADLVPASAVEADVSAEPAKALKADKAAASPGGCQAAGSPADRAICADPDLQRLQARLRDAYADALEAHTDRTVLRQRQLAWREARNAVTDPDRLAALYEQRIRKLESATADARRQR